MKDVFDRTAASWSVLHGPVIEQLRTLPANSVQTAVTSPPYYGLRSYLPAGHPDKIHEIGCEATPETYIGKLVEVFSEVRRVLTDDGTLWLNIGDSYNAQPGQRKATDAPGAKQATSKGSIGAPSRSVEGCKPKDLIGIPWMLAFALRDWGWYLRCDIIWHKPNGMPASQTDRPTRNHEYVFLLSKSRRYYYNAKAIAEKATSTKGGASFGKQNHNADGTGQQSRTYERPIYETRTARSVWSITTRSYKQAHFAVMPQALAERCILAGSAPGDMVLDPFAGSGTTLEQAVKHGRRGIGCELNADYLPLIDQRMAKVRPVLVEIAEIGGAA